MLEIALANSHDYPDDQERCSGAPLWVECRHPLQASFRLAERPEHDDSLAQKTLKISVPTYYPTTRHSWINCSGATSSNVTSTAAPTGTL